MKKVNYKPLNGHVLIKQDSMEVKEKVTQSGIVIETGGQASKNKKEILSGIVVAKADEVLGVEIGDRVDWQPFRNYPVEVEGEDYQKVPFEELHGIFTN